MIEMDHETIMREWQRCFDIAMNQAWIVQHANEYGDYRAMCERQGKVAATFEAWANVYSNQNIIGLRDAHLNPYIVKIAKTGG